MRGPGVDVAARITEAGTPRPDRESGAGPESGGEADSPRRVGIGRQRDADRAPQDQNLAPAHDIRPSGTGTEAQADGTEQRRKPVTATAAGTRPGARPPGTGPGPGPGAQADSPQPQTSGAR
ncbi:hypothetical protein ACGFXB_10120, partial [Streptomyces canus]